MTYPNRDGNLNGNLDRPAALPRAADVDAAAVPDGDDFSATLDRLIGEIDALPPGDRARLRDAAVAARIRHRRLCKTLGKLQETLDFLRLGVKYLCFDLEATKRENAYLRKLLDEATGED